MKSLSRRSVIPALLTFALLLSSAPALSGIAPTFSVEGKVTRFDQKWVWLQQTDSKKRKTVSKVPRKWFHAQQDLRPGQMIRMSVPFESSAPMAPRHPASKTTGGRP